ncbi:MAG: hypothetical protein EAX87_13125 [Candidatus Thorarchaeota archaeon]|nr:hypothetical protein [Candidatus Thorarchaeota archaeon]
MSGFTRSIAYPWALTGIFAAVHLVITLIPFNLSVGGGGEISFGLVSAPIIGFLLGPIFGVIAVMAGSLLAMTINPLIALLGPFTALATAAGAFAAGAMRTRIRISVPVIFVMAMIVYLASPVGIAVPVFIWFHLFAFFLSLLYFIPKLSTSLISPLNLKPGVQRTRVFASIWVFCLVAVTLDQAVGSAIGGWYLPPFFGLATIVGFFQSAVLLYAFERIVASLIIAVVISALLEVLSKADYGLPLTRIGGFELLELQDEEI